MNRADNADATKSARTHPVANDLYASPNAIADYYKRFRVAERFLLSGHSHQAWPDCGFAAQQQAWLDAAEWVDDKWPLAFAKADEVRRGYARLLDDPNGAIALGQSTLDLLVRFISALPLKQRPKLISTDGEFHTLRRLFDRLGEEECVQTVRISTDPAGEIAERLSAAIDDRTSAVFVSSVLFQNAHIVPGLDRVAAACARFGAEMVIDAYHHLNVVPFRIRGLENAYILGGGYKYCQLGEGNCALRLPPNCSLRPITSGWYSEFSALADKHEPKRVAYGQSGNRFAGATYDPASNYRAAAIFGFFEQMGLAPALLREVSQHQINILASQFDALDANPRIIRRDRDVPLQQIGGFLVLWSPHAGEICRLWKERGVMTDYRGDGLRIGPAPYLADDQLVEAMNRLGEVIRALP